VSGCTCSWVKLYVPVRRAQPPRPLPPPEATIRHIHCRLHIAHKASGAFYQSGNPETVHTPWGYVQNALIA
jgi:hypothetical protein